MSAMLLASLPFGTIILGVGLGLAIGCGLCSAAGTLIPPMLKGQFDTLFQTSAGQVSVLAALVSLAGIVLIRIWLAVGKTWLGV